MPKEYTDYQFRLEVGSPVAADSPFDSDTLWGRILCSLVLGSKEERALATNWLNELKDKPPDWQPPLLVSEGFQCDAGGEPWLPLPLATKRQLESLGASPAGAEARASRKDLKKISSVPLSQFAQLCASKIDVPKLLELRLRAPRLAPALQPHLAMDRLSGTGVKGRLYMRALHVYLPKSAEGEARENKPSPRKPQHSLIVFFLRLRDPQYDALIRAALERICDEGWGSAKSRGLGRIKFKEYGRWQPTWPVEPSEGFVSLSHFCPASTDPTEGYWKIQPKHPVPAQFLDGRRVVLGEEAKEKWRVKSFLRLRAGSCFRYPPGLSAKGWNGRMLEGLVSPATDANGEALPPLYHYALAFPVPIRWAPKIGP